MMEHTQPRRVPDIARLIGVLLVMWGAADSLRALSALPTVYALVTGRLDAELAGNPLARMMPPPMTELIIPSLIQLLIALPLLIAGIALLRAAPWARTAALFAVLAEVLYSLVYSIGMKLIAPMVVMLVGGQPPSWYTFTSIFTILLSLLPSVLALFFLSAPEARALWPDPRPPTPLLETDEEDEYGEGHVIRLERLALPAIVLRALSRWTDALLRRLPVLPAVTLYVAMFMLSRGAHDMLVTLSTLPGLRDLPHQGIPREYTALSLGSIIMSAVVAALFLIAGISLLRRGAWGRWAAFNGLALSMLVFVVSVVFQFVFASRYPDNDISFAMRDLARTVIVVGNIAGFLSGMLANLALYLALRQTPDVSAPPVEASVPGE